MNELDGRLAAVARQQQALVTLHDLDAAGGTRRQVDSRVRRGLLEPLAPFVFAVGGAPVTRDMELLAAMLGGRGRVAVSHLAAARRWGIPGYARAPMEISVERGVRLQRARIKVHESTDLDRCRILDLDGIPTTDPARTSSISVATWARSASYAMPSGAGVSTWSTGATSSPHWRHMPVVVGPAFGGCAGCWR